MDWLERVAKLGRWTSNDVRAPHKPLLLYALGSYQRDADGELRYSAVEEELKQLLEVRAVPSDHRRLPLPPPGQ